MDRKINIEGRPLAWLAVNRNGAVVVFYDPIDRRQSKASAFAWPFGSEERFKDPLYCLRIDPAASVTDTQPQIPAFMQIGVCLDSIRTNIEANQY